MACATVVSAPFGCREVGVSLTSRILAWASSLARWVIARTSVTRDVPRFLLLLRFSGVDDASLSFG